MKRKLFFFEKKKNTFAFVHLKFLMFHLVDHQTVIQHTHSMPQQIF